MEDVLPHWADLDEERYKAAQDGEDEQSDQELDTRIDLVTRALGSADDKQYKSAITQGIGPPCEKSEQLLKTARTSKTSREVKTT